MRTAEPIRGPPASGRGRSVPSPRQKSPGVCKGSSGPSASFSLSELLTVFPLFPLRAFRSKINTFSTWDSRHSSSGQTALESVPAGSGAWPAAAEAAASPPPAATALALCSWTHWALCWLTHSGCVLCAQWRALQSFPPLIPKTSPRGLIVIINPCFTNKGSDLGAQSLAPS